MKIEVVQLENIRSHIKSTVPFTSGFNCLVGGLGCGKSSVLYAVDFALFGDSTGKLVGAAVLGKLNCDATPVCSFTK